MAELRSFIIGVTIAGSVLLVAGLAFGLFGSASNGSPSVRLISTPPATRTPPPAATRDPSEFTPVAPTATSGAPAGETPGGETPGEGTPAPGETESPIQTATPTLEVAPTTAATDTPVPQVSEVGAYVDSANSYTPSLVAQIEYLIGNTSAPSIADPTWQNFTIESAQNIQALAGGLASLAAPACVSNAHGGLVAAANQASAAAGAVISAVNASDAGAVSAQTSNLSAARDAINGAVSNVSTAVAAC